MSRWNDHENRRTAALLLTLAAAFLLLTAVSTASLNVRFDYTLRVVAAGGAMLGLFTGVMGAFAVLREQSLLGDSVSHAALPGVVLAFLLFGREMGWLLLGAGVTGWLAVMFILGVTTTTRLKQDTMLGVALTGFFALGVAGLTYTQDLPDASQAGLDKFIFGQAAAIGADDLTLIAVVGGAALLLVVLLWKEFKLVTFNPAFAQANGYPARSLEILLSTLVVVAIVLSLRLAGVILTVGLLIAPAVAARQWTQRLANMILLSGAFGAFAGASGAVISAIEAGLPTGPLIIVVAFFIVLLSLLVAPQRGVIERLLRERRDRARFAAETLLRDLGRHAHKHGDPGFGSAQSMLIGLRGRSARPALHLLQRRGLAAPDSQDDPAWSLTPQGQAQYAALGSHSHSAEDATLPEVTR